MMKKTILRGASGDSLYLMLTKLVTMLLGMAVARILSQTLSLAEYGSYSEIMLLTSTLSALTIMGMADGVNYFFYNNNSPEQRNRYISTIFSLQYILSASTGILLLLFSKLVVRGFQDENLNGLLIYAAILPLLNNLVLILQVLFVAVGKARLVAVRNLLLSLSKLVLFTLAACVIKSVAAVLGFALVLDAAQIFYFRSVLRKNECPIFIKNTDFSLCRRIFQYCIPMSAFIIISTLTRDCDKYIISAFTDPETLAVYSNAAKMLPFDIVYASFVTVLVPYLTQYIAKHNFTEAKKLYSVFMELSLLTTAILACSAVVAAPMLLELLYSRKYIGGLRVFIIYIIVDIFRTLNITLILSSAGKTKELFIISSAALLLNAVLNIVLFKCMGITGPAVSTLIVTIISGALIQKQCAVILQCRFSEIFNAKNILYFCLKTFPVMAGFAAVSLLLEKINLHYFIKLLIVGGGCGTVLCAVNIKQIIRYIKMIDSYRLNT